MDNRLRSAGASLPAQLQRTSFSLGQEMRANSAAPNLLLPKNIRRHKGCVLGCWGLRFCFLLVSLGLRAVSPSAALVPAKPPAGRDSEGSTCVSGGEERQLRRASQTNGKLRIPARVGANLSFCRARARPGCGGRSLGRQGHCERFAPLEWEAACGRPCTRTAGSAIQAAPLGAQRAAGRPIRRDQRVCEARRTGMPATTSRRRSDWVCGPKPLPTLSRTQACLDGLLRCRSLMAPREELLLAASCDGRSLISL